MAIVANAIAGTLALVAWRVPRVRGRVVWIATIAAEVAVLLQVLVGVILVASHRYEAPRFHMFYGFVGLIAITILYSYRSQLKHKLYLLYGFGGLFVMGLGIRAMLVGKG